MEFFVTLESSVTNNHYMYSDKKSILELVALFKQSNLRHIVLCPGSRNAPIVHSFSVDDGFVCYPVTDERSAGFYAIGLSIQTGEPVVVCCTSGSALANLYPSVVEAYYQRIPIVVVSADRPEAWIGQMDGQTMPQPQIFGSFSLSSITLPSGDTNEDKWLRNRLLNESLLTLSRSRGPIHINVPLAEPLFNFEVENLPSVRKIKVLPSSPTEVKALAQQSSSVLIIVGQLSQLEAERYAPYLTSLAPHAVLLGEHLSNIPGVIGNFDTVLATLDVERLKQLSPELVITLGGHIISKRLKQWLRQEPPRWHWHIAPQGELADLFEGALTHICDESIWFSMSREMAGETSVVEASPYQALWRELSELLPPPNTHYSSLSAVGALMKHLPSGSALHIANSLSVRLAQLYPLNPRVCVQCNRGVNGIEGSLSTALGYARVTNVLNFVLIGDLSFFYDMNALCTPLSANVRILVLNNAGGGIFSTLPGLSDREVSYQYIVGSQKRSVRAWAVDSGMEYLCVTDDSELQPAIERLTSEDSANPILLEVMTDTNTDNEAMKKYYTELNKLLK